jgi:hypothetical protein
MLNPNIHDAKKISLLSMTVGRAMNTLVNVAPAKDVSVDLIKAWNVFIGFWRLDDDALLWLLLR